MYLCTVRPKREKTPSALEVDGRDFFEIEILIADTAPEEDGMYFDIATRRTSSSSAL